MYLFDEDTSPEDYHASAFSFPHIRKSNQIDSNADFASEEPAPCTEDIKICPDGALVERDPYNDCQFYPCPDRELENVDVDDSYEGPVLGDEITEEFVMQLVQWFSWLSWFSCLGWLNCLNWAVDWLLVSRLESMKKSWLS